MFPLSLNVSIFPLNKKTDMFVTWGSKNILMCITHFCAVSFSLYQYKTFTDSDMESVIGDSVTGCTAKFDDTLAS